MHLSILTNIRKCDLMVFHFFLWRTCYLELGFVLYNIKGQYDPGHISNGTQNTNPRETEWHKDKLIFETCSWEMYKESTVLNCLMSDSYDTYIKIFTTGQKVEETKNLHVWPWLEYYPPRFPRSSDVPLFWEGRGGGQNLKNQLQEKEPKYNHVGRTNAR